MNDEVRVNDSAANAPDEVMKLAKKFLERHDCPVILTREASGYHLYIPCPECLKTHLREELDDPKYSINLSMLAGLGEYEDTTHNSWMPGAVDERRNLEKRREYGSGICMRTRSAREPHRIPIDELLHMATVTERHPEILTQASMSGGVGSAEREEMWEEDPVSGISCPPPAGKMRSITNLPPGHPAVAYLKNRGYDPSAIENQFRLSFCHTEYPSGSEKSIYYRKMPGGWKDTPQHRIIFHSLVDSAPLTWQGRLIEKVSDDGLNRYMLHPYAGGYYEGNLGRDSADTDSLGADLRRYAASDADPLEIIPDVEGTWGYLWSHTDTRANPQAPWQPVPPFDEMRDGTLRFKPSKYRTAKYSSRNMMGWDAAIERAFDDPDDLKWVVLCEGPLDAARAGPGAVALIGSSLSEDNAIKIASNFHVAFLAFDADKAGRDATGKITQRLSGVKCRAPILNAILPMPIPSGKDVGDLSTEEYQKIFQRILKRSKR